MAWVFNTQEAANFNTMINQTGNRINIPGVNATEQDANIICNGIDSLLAIGGRSSIHEEAIRTVKDDVEYQD